MRCNLLNLMDQSQWLQNAIHTSEIAKTILHAVTSDNPEFRYAIGKDAMLTLE